MARSRSAGHVGCGCISWLHLLTCVLVILKLGGAINLSWLAVTMPTWGPYVLTFVLAYLFVGGSRGRSTRRRRTTTRRRRTTTRRRRAPFL